MVAVAVAVAMWLAQHQLWELFRPGLMRPPFGCCLALDCWDELVLKWVLFAARGRASDKSPCGRSWEPSTGC